jgi:hypothetical protein
MFFMQSHSSGSFSCKAIAQDPSHAKPYYGLEAQDPSAANTLLSHTPHETFQVTSYASATTAHRVTSHLGFNTTGTSPVFEPMTGSLGNHLIHQQPTAGVGQ